MNKLLNHEQADAVFTAMCALNNVSASRNQLSIGAIEIDHVDGSISIVKRDRPQGLRIVAQEDYSNPAAFTEAYGLVANAPAPQPTVHLIGIDGSSKKLPKFVPNPDAIAYLHVGKDKNLFSMARRDIPCGYYVLVEAAKS